MQQLPTLRRELLTAFGLVFAGAMLVAATGILIVVPRLESGTIAAVYIFLLVGADLVVFAFFGRWLLRTRVLGPVDRMIDGIAAIAEGEYSRRLPAAETRELARLAEAVNRMAERLIANQEQLGANIASLQETNRLLTEARDELVRAEKLASVGRLGAGIAHEIGNPLGAVLGYLAVLGKRVGPAEKELIEAAEAEARRIDKIVRSLLDYARPREARARPIAVCVRRRRHRRLAAHAGQARADPGHARPRARTAHGRCRPVPARAGARQPAAQRGGRAQREGRRRDHDPHAQRQAPAPAAAARPTSGRPAARGLLAPPAFPPVRALAARGPLPARR